MAQYTPPESIRIGNGTETVFGFDWPYLVASDIKVTVDGVLVTTFLATTQQVLVSPAPAMNSIIRIYRDTPAQEPEYVFSGGVPFLPRYVDENNRQLLHALQEGLLDFDQTNALAQQAVRDAAQAILDSTSALNGTQRALRVPLSEPALPTLPSAVTRANKQLGFNDLGLPVVTMLSEGSIGDFALMLAGSGGANMVGYEGMMVDAKLAAWVDIREKGAIDGAADNTAAIQAACDEVHARGGGTVFVPLGFWRKSTRVQMYKDTTLLCDPGAIVQRVGTTDSWMFVNGEVGNTTYANGYDGDGHLSIIGGTFDLNGIVGVRTAAAFVIGHTRRVLFQNCKFMNGYNSHNIEINASSDFLFLHCQFLDQQYDLDGSSYEVVNIDYASAAGFPGFGAWDGTPDFGGRFISCTFRNVHSGVASHSVPTGTPHRAIFIIGCMFENIGYRAIRAQGWDESFICFNWFRNVGNEFVTILTGNRNTVRFNVMLGGSQMTSGQFSAVRIAGNYNHCGDNIIDNTGFANQYPYPYGVASGTGNIVNTLGAQPGSSFATGGIVSNNGTLTRIDGEVLLYNGDAQAPTTITLADSLANYKYLIVTTGQVAGGTFQTHIVRPYTTRRWNLTDDRFTIQTFGGAIQGTYPSLTSINITADVQHVRRIYGIV